MPEESIPSDTSVDQPQVDQPGERLHHHVHVVFKSHLNSRGDPRELEGELYTIIESNDEKTQVQNGIPGGSQPDLSKKIPAKKKGPQVHTTGQELKHYSMRKKRAWLGEIVQRNPTFKAERLVMATDKPLDLAEDVNYSRTPSGALRLGLILLAILGIVEWWQLGAIQNAQGLDTGQLASKWAFFFWGCLLFGVIALVAISKTKSGRRIEYHCDPRYAEFCAMGNHVGIVGNSKQRSVLAQALDFVGHFDMPTMEFLRESLIKRDRSQRNLITKLQASNHTVQRDANFGAQSDWAALSRFQRNLSQEVDPPDLNRRKGGIPDWLILMIFLGFLGAIFVLYPGSGGGG